MFQGRAFAVGGHLELLFNIGEALLYPRKVHVVQQPEWSRTQRSNQMLLETKQRGQESTPPPHTHTPLLASGTVEFTGSIYGGSFLNSPACPVRT